MITTILLDVGGTIYIKNANGIGEINPAIILLLEKIPSSIQIVLVSDTDFFDIHELMNRDMPALTHCTMFSKKQYPWIDKTNPITYQTICNLLVVSPEHCILIDNDKQFREGAERAGLKSCDVTIGAITRLTFV